jgi:epoxyqueuosine reductase QueG
MDHDFLETVRSFGASAAGVAPISDGPGGLPFAVSVAVRLSDAIVDEIVREPTYTYFNHYRSVNALIDQILLRTGLWLQARGARYLTVAASQSRPDSPFEGRYSHKKAACLAGLGSMGRNGLFLHREWGARVRLGTVCTDWAGCECLVPESPGEFLMGDSAPVPSLHPLCASCDLCVAACPSGALGPAGMDAALPGQGEFDPARCSAWMKKAYQHIGRGVVCGMCLKVCPASNRIQ